MEIVFDFTVFERFINLPTAEIVWRFFANFGWPFLAIAFLYGVRDLYLYRLRGKWSEGHKFILLAIDIPRGIEQTPKAVENMFTYFGGAHGSISFFEKWFLGLYQKSFSFEIVSIDGYTQFLIRTPAEWRNLVESSVYSQYPDAEIFEVEDYVNNVPKTVPDDEYDFWGVEFIQGAPEPYPIKCYQEFEHSIGPSEMQFKDPMASLMDLCGSLKEGEQLWFQIVVAPTDFSWIKNSEKEINKILERKTKVKEDFFDKGVKVLGDVSEMLYPLWGDVSDEKKEDKPKTMMDLSPGEKEKLEAITSKASKLGFEAKIRVIYMAKKDVMNKGKVVSGFVGFIKQFISLNLNNLKPEMKRTATKGAYFGIKQQVLRKKRRLLEAYTSRSDSIGPSPGVFNIEELATLWHFPVEGSVKSAMIQKAPGRKANAPSSLPVVENEEESEEFINMINSDEDATPENLEKELFEEEDEEKKEARKEITEEDNKKNSIDDSEFEKELEDSDDTDFFYQGRGSDSKSGPPPNLPTL
ncbi:MAG: hypothetical protein PF488_02100 [Patescibacteria group bacterium]|jgi:hypothetical protein|nr:hypothetical protein [Patescibacteria group bacterium]